MMIRSRCISNLIIKELIVARCMYVTTTAAVVIIVNIKAIISIITILLIIAIVW